MQSNRGMMVLTRHTSDLAQPWLAAICSALDSCCLVQQFNVPYFTTLLLLQSFLH